MRRGLNGEGLTSVALGPCGLSGAVRSWSWLKRWRRERRRSLSVRRSRQRGRCGGSATDFGLLAAVLKCPQSDIM
jgi:hypothetical protein